MRYAVIALSTCVSFAQKLPDAPSASKRVADRAFWSLSAFNATATTVDMITTSALVSHTSNCPREVWGETLYGVHANDGRVVAVMAGKAATATLMSYLLKKHNVRLWRLKLWYLPLVYNAQAHVQGAVNNMRVCR